MLLINIENSAAIADSHACRVISVSQVRGIYILGPKLTSPTFSPHNLIAIVFHGIP